MYLSDLHTHTIASGHGSQATITAMARSASQKGLRLLGITDHGPATLCAATASYFRSLKSAPRHRLGIDLLYGAECSVTDEEGSLDLPDDVLDGLDYCIASLHPRAKAPSGRKGDTAALLGAMQKPWVRILGHIDDTAYDLDYPLLIKACASHQVIVEMNEASLSPGGYRGDTRPRCREILSLCQALEVPILLSSDSHGAEHVGDFPTAERFVHENLFPESLILNNQIPRLRMILSLRGETHPI